MHKDIQTTIALAHRAGREEVIEASKALLFKGLNDQRTYLLLLSAVEVITARIDELAQIGTFRPDYMRSKLPALAAELAAAATRFQNTAVAFGATDDELSSFVETTSDIADAVKAALRHDNGAALRKIFADKPFRAADFIHETGGRPATGMSSERKFLAQRAIDRRRQMKGARWHEVGLRVFRELVNQNERTGEEDWTVQILQNYCLQTSDGLWLVADKKGLGNFLKALHRDYKKLAVI